ncbi:MAG: EamA family transporter [Propionibacteriales bacterium]|nr:EamA family transporter [Propionibacteriales bacterium]
MNELAVRLPGASSTTLGAFACATGMTVVGTSVALAPTLAGYPVLAGQAWRYLLAGLTLLGVLVVRRERFPRLTLRQSGRLLLLAATGLAGFNWCLIEGAKQTDPAFLASVLGATPVVLAVAGPLLAGRRVRPRTLAGSAVVATGIVIVQGATLSPMSAVPYAVGLLLCEVAFTLLAVPLLRSMTAVQLSAAVCLLAVPLLAALAVLEPGADLQLPSRPEAVVLTYLAVLTTAVAFLLWYGGVARLGADRAGLFAGLMPGAGFVAGVALGTVAWSLPALGGSLLCGLGIVVGLKVGGPETAPAQDVDRRSAPDPRRGSRPPPRRPSYSQILTTRPRTGGGFPAGTASRHRPGRNLLASQPTRVGSCTCSPSTARHEAATS